MTNSAKFDPNALAAVKPGMDGTLAEISVQLEKYLGAPAANAQALETTRAELHRLLGVLKMVGLDGAAIFCAEMELALGELGADPQQVSAMHRDVLHHALFAITHFLDSLANGADNAALRLYPQYQELQHLRGLEMSFELDLFYPNLVVRLPHEALSALLEGEPKHLKVLRGQFQQGLLRWLRQEDAPAAAQMMQQSLDEVMRSMPKESDRRAFWWVGCGFLDCLKADKLPMDFNARKLLGSIDQQLRAVSESSRGDAQPVMNEMLYLIGHSHDVSDLVEEVRQVYALDNYLLELSVLPPSEVTQILGVLRDQMRVAQETWELCIQGDADACKKFIEYAGHMAEQSDKLDRNTLQYLAKQIQALAQYATVPDHAIPIGLDMAMALLLLSSGIENYSHLGSGFQEQARILSERMQAAVKQQPEDTQRMQELVDLHGQMEQGNAMVPLANEMLTNLQHVEQGLNAYFNNPTTKRDDLAEILRLLAQIQGGLHMLSLEHAEQLLAALQENVRRFAQGEITKPVENHALADGVSALENYLQHLTHRQSGDFSLLQKAVAEMAKARQAATEMLAAEAEQPGESQEPAFTPIAPVEPLQFTVPEPAAALEAAQAAVAKPQPKDEDQELLEIFLEEAQEVLGTIHDNLEICQLRPENREPLVAIKRGFHTLKGSGRMVGLNDFGEIAWCVERAMNKWLEDNDKPATPGLLQFVGEAVKSFTGWVGALNKQGKANIEADGLVAEALKVENSLDAEISPAATVAETEILKEADIPQASESVTGLDEEQLTKQESRFEQVLEFNLDTQPEQMPENTPASEAIDESALEFNLDTQPKSAPETNLEPEEMTPLPVLDFNLDPLPTLEQPLALTPGLELISEPAVMPEVVTETTEVAVATGETTLSPALFKIAASEAKQNVAVMHIQFSELCAAAPPAIKYDFMRAAHTLAGVNRTMGFPDVVKLAYALEGWLQARIEQPFSLSDEQLEMLLETITALDEMVQSICDQQTPERHSDLTNRLLEDKGKLGEPPLLPEPAPVEVKAKITAPKPTPTQARPPVPIPTPTLIPAVPAPASAAIQTVQSLVRDDVDEQLLPVFIEEADDLSPMIGAGIRAWREHPNDDLQVQSLRRLLHTMKGSSRMVGAMRIGEIAHEMEDRVLAAVKLRNQPGYWDSLETDFDRITVMLEELRSGKVIPLAVGRRMEDQADVEEKVVDRRALIIGTERALVGSMLRVRSDVVDRLVNEASEISVARLHMETELRFFKEGLQDLSSSVARLRQQLREVEIQAESQMQAQVSFAKDGTESFDPLEFDRFTRLQELTRFMNESVHDVQTVQQTLLKNLDEVSAAMAGQARINRELQQGLMNVRMVPFSSIADRLYRIVRQTGKEINKRANLELVGSSVELDRSVLEKMTAPFEHLLRNAMVHGLEKDQERSLGGKNPIGEIRLSVRQESNEVLFDLTDDGAGLNFTALREKAIAKGLLDSGAKVSDDQLAQLIFTTGLSTATEITEIAGRGIGMDVVRSEIAALGGRIDVSSKRGLGTHFIIHLPLTLAVMQALMVRSGDAVYAIPSTMVEQVSQVKSADMERLHLERRVEWQGKVYPLHYMPHLLGNIEQPLENLPRNPVLLLRSAEQRIALHVDELMGNQEVVVKNIGPQLARLSGVSGATVLGNGRVVLILNPTQLAQRIGSTSMAGAKAKAVQESGVQPLHTQPLVMVVDDSLTVRKVTTRMLTRAGYRVVTAKDGVDALEQLEQFTPQVMLLDIEMPRMDGFALARQLRRDPRTQNLPIIMITSRTADKHRDYAKQLGINTYLGKPYQEDILLQNIADFVAVHKLDA